MNSSGYKVRIATHFRKQLDKLAKKNPQVRVELWKVLLSLDLRQHTPLGNHIYKIRLKGFKKGKSGGYRTYVCALDVKGVLIPICIYPKNEKEQLSDGELKKHILKIQKELDILW